MLTLTTSNYTKNTDLTHPPLPHILDQYEEGINGLGKVELCEIYESRLIQGVVQEFLMNIYLERYTRIGGALIYL